MKRPAIFFDRDNTLIICDGYLGDPAQVALMPGAADAVARARRLGFATVIVSNQSGVGKGIYTEDDVQAVNSRLDTLLAAENSAAVIDRHEYCPFHPEATVARYRQESELRKPRPGMIIKAAEQLALDLSRSWLIGDAPRDIEAGKAAGCRTILFCDPDAPRSPMADEPTVIAPDHTVSRLEDAMDIIERDGQEPQSAQSRIEPEPQPAPVPTAAPAPPAPPAPPVALNEPTAPVTVSPTVSVDRLEHLAGEILRELRHRNEQDHTDFSVSKLLAGIVQILALAVLFYAYINRGDAALPSTLLLAIMLQTLTVALLIMGRQK